MSWQTQGMFIDNVGRSCRYQIWKEDGFGLEKEESDREENSGTGKTVSIDQPDLPFDTTADRTL